jgi:hypothetical protein
MAITKRDILILAKKSKDDGKEEEEEEEEKDDNEDEKEDIKKEKRPKGWTIAIDQVKTSLSNMVKPLPSTAQTNVNLLTSMWANEVQLYVQYVRAPDTVTSLPRSYFLRGYDLKEEKGRDVLARYDLDIDQQIPRNVINYLGYEIMKKMTPHMLKKLPTKISEELIDYMAEEFRDGIKKIHKSELKKKLQLAPLEKKSGFDIEIQSKDGFKLPFDSLQTMFELIISLLLDYDQRRTWLNILDYLQSSMVPKGFLRAPMEQLKDTVFWKVYNGWVPLIVHEFTEKIVVAIDELYNDLLAYKNDPTSLRLLNMYTEIWNTCITDNENFGEELADGNAGQKYLYRDMSKLIFREYQFILERLHNVLNIEENEDLTANNQAFMTLGYIETIRKFRSESLHSIVTVFIDLIINKDYFKTWERDMDEIQLSIENQNMSVPAFFNQFRLIRDRNKLDSSNIWYIDKANYKDDYKNIGLFLSNLSNQQNNNNSWLCNGQSISGALDEANVLFFYESPGKEGDVQGIVIANVHKSKGTPERTELQFKDSKYPVYIMTIYKFCFSTSEDASSTAIGDKLMAQVTEFAKQRNLNYIHVASLAHRFAFYKRNGFLFGRNIKGKEAKKSAELWSPVAQLGNRLWDENNILKVQEYTDLLQHLIEKDLAHNKDCDQISLCNLEGYDMTLTLKARRIRRGEKAIQRERKIKPESPPEEKRRHRRKEPRPPQSEAERAEILSSIPFDTGFMPSGNKYGLVEFTPPEVHTNMLEHAIADSSVRNRLLANI